MYVHDKVERVKDIACGQCNYKTAYRNLLRIHIRAVQLFTFLMKMKPYCILVINIYTIYQWRPPHSVLCSVHINEPLNAVPLCQSVSRGALPLTPSEAARYSSDNHHWRRRGGGGDFRCSSNAAAAASNAFSGRITCWSGWKRGWEKDAAAGFISKGLLILSWRDHHRWETTRRQNELYSRFY